MGESREREREGEEETHEVNSLKLSSIGISTHRSSGVPLTLDVVVVSGRDGVDVSRGNGVDSNVEGSELDGKGLDEVDASGLGGVVGSLLLGVVDDVTTGEERGKGEGEVSQNEERTNEGN